MKESLERAVGAALLAEAAEVLAEDEQREDSIIITVTLPVSIVRDWLKAEAAPADGPVTLLARGR